MGRDPKNPVFQFVPIPNSQCWEMGQVLVLKLMSPALTIYNLQFTIYNLQFTIYISLINIKIMSLYS